MSDDVVEFLKAGADAFVSKPITHKDLKRAVEKSFSDALDLIC
jgi:FixJ family two-component response regulator